MSGSVKLQGTAIEWLLRGALAAASKDDVTPVLCAVHWVIGDGRVTVTATDRYRVHQLHVPAPAGTPDGEFLMTRHQAALLLKSWHTPRREHRSQVVVLSWTDPEPQPADPTAGRYPRGKVSPQVARRYSGSIAFDIFASDEDGADRISHDAAQVRGTFPPVGRLFPDETDGGEPVNQLLLAPEYLAATAFLRSGFGSLRFVFPRVKEGEPQAARAQPLLVVNTEGTARALIQPNIGLDTAKRYGA